MEGSKVPRQTNLVRRDGRYYYRSRVPHDLVDILGRREVKYALGTADTSEARRLVHEKALEVQRTFEEARLRRDAVTVDCALGERLEAIARDVYAEELRFHDERQKHHPNLDLEELEIALDESLEPWAMGLHENLWYSDADAKVADYLEAHGLRLPEDSPSFSVARRLIARAIGAANRTALKQARGDYGFEFDDPLVKGAERVTARPERQPHWSGECQKRAFGAPDGMHEFDSVDFMCDVVSIMLQPSLVHTSADRRRTRDAIPN